MYTFRLILFAGILCSIGITACTNGKKQGNPAGEVQVAVKALTVQRYEKALFSIDTRNLKEGVSHLYPEYKFFLGDDWKDTMNLLRLYNFVNDPNIRELYDLTLKKYPDTLKLQKDLTRVFDKIHQNFPGTYPKVFTYVSGLDVEMPVIYADTVLAISLDLFLGRDVDAYRKAGIPEYKIDRFSEEFLLPACIDAISDSLVKRDDSKQSLLDLMVVAGKVLYLEDMVLPEVQDSYKIGYTPEKFAWCKENESNIWAFLISNQLLFSSDPQATTKLMTDAPFTSGFVNESPGRIGEWVGWQIVRAYMKENPSVSIQQLMANTDAQAILQGSRYKPGK